MYNEKQTREFVESLGFEGIKEDENYKVPFPIPEIVADLHMRVLCQNVEVSKFYVSSNTYEHILNTFPQEILEYKEDAVYLWGGEIQKTSQLPDTVMVAVPASKTKLSSAITWNSCN